MVLQTIHLSSAAGGLHRFKLIQRLEEAARCKPDAVPSSYLMHIRCHRDVLVLSDTSQCQMFILGATSTCSGGRGMSVYTACCVADKGLLPCHVQC